MLNTAGALQKLTRVQESVREARKTGFKRKSYKFSAKC